MKNATNLDRAAVRQAAQAALDTRLAALDTAVDAANRVSDLAAQLEEAESAASRAVLDAQRVGWSTEELRTFGITAPTSTTRRKRGAAPRGRARRTADGPQDSPAPSTPDATAR
ncbi:hypothetical protein [uncultured Cellulomonas sp.]|uniref:hypothetical protein n=1 Tax=uncultured Cellulomonas sp. TaxID=189682 RepID=UPI00262583D0|nr:hypothetical protein [uncultured Cellulomonas sp.]